MIVWVSRLFAWAATPRVAAVAAGGATICALLRPLAPLTDLLLVAAAACTAALALTRRRLWPLAVAPFLLLLADRPGPLPGEVTLPTGGAAESYTVRPPQGPPRLHHLGFWIEGLQWDVQAASGSLQLRRPAEEEPLTIPLAAGVPAQIGPFAMTPVALGRSASPASVSLEWELRGGGGKGVATVSVGGSVTLPGEQTLRVAESRAAFNRQGPVVRVDDGAGDARWLFRRYPEHDMRARTGPLGVRWKDSTAASVVRLEVRPGGPSLRRWLADHPPPVALLLAALLMGLLALRGRPRSVGAALLVAAAIASLPGRTAPSLGGDFAAPPYADGDLVTVDVQVGAANAAADVVVPVLLRLPVGGAGALLGLAALLVALALAGLGLGGAGVTHGRSALRAAGLLLAAMALFLLVRPHMGPAGEVGRAQVDAALRTHAPAPNGRAIVDWAPSKPGPYAPGPAGADLALLGIAAVAGIYGARRR